MDGSADEFTISPEVFLHCSWHDSAFIFTSRDEQEVHVVCFLSSSRMLMNIAWAECGGRCYLVGDRRTLPSPPLHLSSQIDLHAWPSGTFLHWPQWNNLPLKLSLRRRETLPKLWKKGISGRKKNSRIKSSIILGYCIMGPCNEFKNWTMYHQTNDKIC